MEPTICLTLPLWMSMQGRKRTAVGALLGGAAAAATANAADGGAGPREPPMLAAFGINHEKLTYRFQGRDFRLTDVHGNIAHGIFA